MNCLFKDKLLGIKGGLSMKKTYYLYRFLDKNKKILYIGRTNDITRRILKEHFTENTHLPNECYLDISAVEYAEFQNESEEVAYEAILINKEKPIYNTQFKDSAEFDVNILNIEWKPFQWEFEGQMEYMKALKRDTICAVDIPVLEQNLKNYCCFGFPDIDKQVILSSTTTTLISAPSGVHKTNYALQIAMANVKCGKTVLYINLKNSMEELLLRVLSQETICDIKNLQTNNLTSDEWRQIGRITPDLRALNFYNYLSAGTSLEQIEHVIKEAKCDLVIIDDINSISDFTNSYDIDKTQYSMNSLKLLSLTIKCPLILLHSLSSKNICQRNDQRPMLSDLPYNSLCSYSDIIQFLYRSTDELKNPFLEVITVKSNVGQIGCSKLGIHNLNLISIEK